MTSAANTNLESVFTDINDNIYKPEVEDAAAMKIVTAFEDNTFRSRKAITREKLIMMAVDALGKVSNVDLETEPQRDIVTFKDVSGNRWSAKKIKWAQWNFLNVSHPNNALRPTESITRAKLIDTMRSVTIYLNLKKQLNLPMEIQQNQKPVQFSDISGNLAKNVISQMSGYYGVVSPFNEQGIDFDPERKVPRDYTTALLVRVLECIQSESKQANNITER